MGDFSWVTKIFFLIKDCICLFIIMLVERFIYKLLLAFVCFLTMADVSKTNLHFSCFYSLLRNNMPICLKFCKYIILMVLLTSGGLVINVLSNLNIQIMKIDWLSQVDGGNNRKPACIIHTHLKRPRIILTLMHIIKGYNAILISESLFLYLFTHYHYFSSK